MPEGLAPSSSPERSQTDQARAKQEDRGRFGHRGAAVVCVAGQEQAAPIDSTGQALQANAREVHEFLEVEQAEVNTPEIKVEDIELARFSG